MKTFLQTIKFIYLIVTLFLFEFIRFLFLWASYCYEQIQVKTFLLAVLSDLCTEADPNSEKVPEAADEIKLQTITEAQLGNHEENQKWWQKHRKQEKPWVELKRGAGEEEHLEKKKPL